MVKEKEFQCRRCGIVFLLKAKKAYYCPACQKKHASEYAMKKRAEKNPAVLIGVGSGGNQRGQRNHRFIDGRSHYKEVFDRENPYQNFCEICGSSKYLVVHHLDENRKNNASENLVKVCRSCHAQLHKLAENFGGKVV